MQLPIVFLIATVLDAVWSLRESNSKVSDQITARSKINLLRETRHREAAIRFEELALTMLQGIKCLVNK